MKWCKNVKIVASVASVAFEVFAAPRYNTQHMANPTSQISDDRIKAAIKITEEFEQSIAAIKNEHDDLVKKTIKAGEQKAAARVRDFISKIFSSKTN